MDGPGPSGCSGTRITWCIRLHLPMGAVNLSRTMLTDTDSKPRTTAQLHPWRARKKRKQKDVVKYFGEWYLLLSFLWFLSKPVTHVKHKHAHINERTNKRAGIRDYIKTMQSRVTKAFFRWVSLLHLPETIWFTVNTSKPTIWLRLETKSFRSLRRNHAGWKNALYILACLILL